MPFARTDRGRFFYEDRGTDGPRVYLLHGLTACSRDWDGVPEALARTGFRVLAFDMRGHGSTFPRDSTVEDRDADYSPEGHARDLEACAGALGHGRMHLVGHSTGGRNALVFAALFPERALSLTIIDQTLAADPQSWKKYEERFAGYPTPFLSEGALEGFLREKAKGDDRRFHYFKSQFRGDERGHWDWNFSPRAVRETQKRGRERDLHDLLARVKCPVLFLRGGASRYVSPEEAEKIRKLLPQGAFVTVEKAGHAVFRDNPEGFLRVLVPFLKGAAAGG